MKSIKVLLDVTIEDDFDEVTAADNLLDYLCDETITGIWSVNGAEPVR